MHTIKGWNNSSLLTMHMNNSHIRDLYNFTSIFIVQALPC
nr:MAG TPA: hypothetical protein [Caudoviricetes sp.]